MNYELIEQGERVNDITLLYLAKTATKKTLELFKGNNGRYYLTLMCELDEYESQLFYIKADTKYEAEELQKDVIKWMNY